jgi:hypothetical protein
MNLRQHRRRATRSRGFGWGKRCPDYYPGCFQCEAWKFYDNTGRWPRYEELK